MKIKKSSSCPPLFRISDVSVWALFLPAPFHYSSSMTHHPSPQMFLWIHLCSGSHVRPPFPSTLYRTHFLLHLSFWVITKPSSCSLSLAHIPLLGISEFPFRFTHIINAFLLWDFLRQRKDPQHNAHLGGTLKPPTVWYEHLIFSQPCVWCCLYLLSSVFSVMLHKVAPGNSLI